MTSAIVAIAWQAALAVGPAETPFVGVNAGAPIWGGSILLTPSKAADIAGTGCRLLRVNFRLDGHASWDASLLASYDQIIQNALNQNIVVLGLLCNEIMPVGQTAWNDDPDGDGMNSYVTDFSTTAYTLINRYKSQIKRFELWNEPDAWTNPNYASDPKNAGGTYMLPRVYAKLLAETYLQCNWYSGRRILTDNGITLSTGGVFAHDIGGSNPTGYFAYQYWGDVYAQSVWSWMQTNVGRRYPWDYFGYHFYLRQGTTFSASQLGQYMDRMRSRMNANGDTSKFLVTEFGWNTLSVSETLQAQNLRDAYNYLKGRSDTAAATWYQWQDEPGGSWGLVRADTSHKPSYDEFAAQIPPNPPVAAFSGAPTSGKAPLVVQFTDESGGGPISSWAWAFGDGGTSPAASPQHTYDDPGDYTVTLTVTGLGGSDAETKTAYIHVESSTVASDVDKDGDVDLGDFAFFQVCFNGPNRPAPLAECFVCDFDSDNDVDLADFGVIIACFNGPGRPPAASCPQ